ncbi:MAG: acyltransferase family protein [Thermodesulfobacteriota bacterium]
MTTRNRQTSDPNYPPSDLSWLGRLRGAAIIMIVAWHVNQLPFSGLFLHKYTRFLLPFLDQPGFQDLFTTTSSVQFFFLPIATFCNLGYQGVHLFFVLSGFGLVLSWNASLRKQKIDRFFLFSWMRRRFMRISLPLWFSLVIVLVFLLLFGPRKIYYVTNLPDSPVVWLRLSLLTALGLNGLFPGTIYSINPPLWFIAPLFQFYLIFPILVVLLDRYGPGKFMIFSIIITIVSRFIFIFYLQKSIGWPFALGSFIGCRLAEFGFGMSMATWYPEQHRKWIPNLKNTLLTLSGYAMGLVLATTLWGALFSEMFIGVFLFVLLYFFFNRFNWLSMERIGKYSLGIFLIHYPLMYPLQKLFGLVLPNYILYGQLINFILVMITLFYFGIAFEWSLSRLMPFLQPTKCNHGEGNVS